MKSKAHNAKVPSLKISSPKKHRIYTVSVASVYPLYIAKVVRMGHARSETETEVEAKSGVDKIIRWLTGYSQRQFESVLKKQTDFETFFTEAPKLNPARSLIKGVICGVRIEDIVEPTMREIRYLDKLVDELAKGRDMEKILRKEIKINPDIQAYNNTLSPKDKKICNTLAQEISSIFPISNLKATTNENSSKNAVPIIENKIWHRNPVWFLDGNPIVGYDKLKDSVRLLFWSGQSFDEEGLHPEGSFKAAEIRYTDSSQINTKDIKRWLKKSKIIQWDYKNIRKTRGVLKKVI